MKGIIDTLKKKNTTTNTEILNKPGVYWQEVSSRDHTDL